MSKAYEYRHVVTLEETNVVGNVYYANHIRWQGRVRELFLREFAPEVLAGLSEGFSMATLRCSCEYFAEVFAFDEILIRMRLAELVQNRISITYEYWRCTGASEELVARGEQLVVCLRRERDKMVPTPVPAALREALKPYGGS